MKSISPDLFMQARGKPLLVFLLVVLPVTIVNDLPEHDIDRGVIMTTGMLFAIPSIIFAFLASSQISTGTNAGAVKG